MHEKKMRAAIKDLGFNTVIAEMQDETAAYFTGTMNGTEWEIQIETDGNGTISARVDEEDAEDWNTIGWMEEDGE